MWFDIPSNSSKANHVEANKRNSVRHAYFREYSDLQRLCLLILQHQKHRIGLGARRVYGILFDGAWLWEEYIGSLISGNDKDEDRFYHPKNTKGTGAQRLFHGGVRLIFPDFISKEKQPRIIADAKYKPLENIGNKDYLQVLAYMFRFDAKTGHYLYPESSSADDAELRMNRGLTYENNVAPREDIRVIKHGLQIPTGTSSYASFAAEMKENEKAFQKVLIENS